MRVLIVALVGGSLASVTSHPAAQIPPTNEPLPAFEVASIKRSSGDLSGRPNSSTILTNQPGRLLITNMTVRGIIRNAYGFTIPRRDDVIGGPGWIDDERWDVDALVEGDQSQTRKLLMLRRLLAERFGLVTHRESRQIETFALVMDRRDGKLGPGLRVSKPCVRLPGAPQADATRPCGGRGGPGRIIGAGMTTARLASLLESGAGRPVTDQTGLTGEFDVDLTWSADASMFTAIKEQLGLRLENGTAIVQDSIVIDRVEPPTQN